MKFEEIFEVEDYGVKKTKEKAVAGIFYKGKHYAFADFKSEISKLTRNLKSIGSQEEREKVRLEIEKMQDMYDNSDFMKKLKSLK